MDINMIMQAISNVGFPIVACGALAFLFYREQEQHKEETAKFTEALNQNSMAITKLAEKLGGDSDA